MAFVGLLYALTTDIKVVAKKYLVRDHSSGLQSFIRVPQHLQAEAKGNHPSNAIFVRLFRVADTGFTNNETGVDWAPAAKLFGRPLATQK